MSTYEDVFDNLISSEEDVEPGVMMREPALKCNGSVFAFYYEREGAMCFKLGKGFPIEERGIAANHLNPFKNKPPMTAWFIVGKEHKGAWPELAKIALILMRG